MSTQRRSVLFDASQKIENGFVFKNNSMRTEEYLHTLSECQDLVEQLSQLVVMVFDNTKQCLSLFCLSQNNFTLFQSFEIMSASVTDISSLEVSSYQYSTLIPFSQVFIMIAITRCFSQAKVNTLERAVDVFYSLFAVSVTGFEDG